MSAYESNFPAWSSSGGREETPASHEARHDEVQGDEVPGDEVQGDEADQPDQPDQADQGAFSPTSLTDAPVAAGTDYAGPVPPAESGVVDEPGLVEDDVIVIATQEVAGYGDLESRADLEPVGDLESAGDLESPADLEPAGDLDSSADPLTARDPQAASAQWSEVKALFVDDPSGSVKVASGLVEKAIEGLMASVRQRQDSLASWQVGDAAGTEELRNALRGYRSLFDELDQISRQFPVGQDRMAGGV
jgi:hypothetical protein